MSLLINDSDTFPVEVLFTKEENGTFVFGKGDSKETFTFKRPTWNEMRLIMSSSVIINAANGQGLVDPYKMMDLKIKSLLKDWSLKDGENKLPLTNENIDKLNPDLIQYLFAKLNEGLTPKEEPATPEKPSGA